MFAKLSHILIAATLASQATVAMSQPKSSSRVQFFCQMNKEGAPTTIARNSEQNRALPVIIWQSAFFSSSGYDPFTRCQQVSARFQNFYNRDQLDYLTGGLVNGYTVICATGYGGVCSGGNVLFTLEPGADAEETLQALFDVRYLSAPPLRRGGESSGYSYIDMFELLAPLGEVAESESFEDGVGATEVTTETPLNSPDSVMQEPKIPLVNPEDTIEQDKIPDSESDSREQPIF